jgi:hypothetical protein
VDDRRKRAVQGVREHAREALKDHRVAHEGHLGKRSWLLRAPANQYWLAEVVVLTGPRLLIHGDVSEVLFARYSGEYDEILDWAASSNIDYLASKVLFPDHERFDDELAFYDVQQMLADQQAEPDHAEHERDKLAEFVEDFRSYSYDQREMLEAVADAGMDVQDFTRVGMAVDPAIVFAQEVLLKLKELRPALFGG